MSSKFILFYTSVLLCLTLTWGQDISGKIIDKDTKDPIPYATIQIDETRGTITNEEGFFLITLGDASVTDLTISCLGYATKIVSLDPIEKKDLTIALGASVLELDEVFVSNSTPNADAIMAKVRSRVKDNYRSGPLRYELFYRETAKIDFKSLELEVDKASNVGKLQIAKANKGLENLANDIKASKTIQFRDFKGDLLAKDAENTKLVVEKATKLIDSRKDFSIENVQKRAQDMVLKYLDTTKTYKVKTGLFKIEDSLSLNEAEKESKKNEYLVSELRSNSHDLLRTSLFDEASFLSDIIDDKLYTYSFLDATYFNDELVYVIQFNPKRAKSKFEGKLYISDDTYAILKTDYAFAKGKRGEKVNLKLILGVKYIENRRKGTIIFKKDGDNRYVPYYLKEEEGSYFYVNRPFKFIENSPEKNKIAFDFKIEGNARNKEELLFINSSKMSMEHYTSLKEHENTPYTLLHRYEPTIWQNSKVIAPLEEMRNFKVSEQY
ncbi:MAG: carboxypeptidase-like regulatory domain-containing protein [Bacteroidota bacterium]